MSMTTMTRAPSHEPAPSEKEENVGPRVPAAADSGHADRLPMVVVAWQRERTGSAVVRGDQLVCNNGAGWASPSTYSASSDYDGVSFWVNSGSSQSTLTSLAVFDKDSNSHFLHLEDLYGLHFPRIRGFPFRCLSRRPFLRLPCLRLPRPSRRSASSLIVQVRVTCFSTMSR